MPITMITELGVNHFVGTWNTTFSGGSAGTTKITIKANGRGSYDHKGGQLYGEFSRNNTIYAGHWTQNDGSEGMFEFHLTGDRSFAGEYSSEGGGASGQWQGTKS